MTAGILQRLSQLEAALEARGLSGEAHREGIHAARSAITRYAWLETQLLGGVSCPVPLHALQSDLPADPLAAAEFTAARERERLGLTAPEAGDVMALLDHDGLKVYRAPFPPDSPLWGFFLFDPDSGPAFVTARALDPLENDAVFARLHGHYVLDVDPYRIRLVVEGAAPEPEELRARAFAAAFLVPGSDLAAYLRAAGVPEDAAIPPALLGSLAQYFEVSRSTLVTRLLALGRLDPGRVPAALAEGAPEVSDRGEAVLGERFVRLALEAHARRLLDLATLAQFLESTPAVARRLAARFTLPASP
jgi:hypothetical protein